MRRSSKLIAGLAITTAMLALATAQVLAATNFSQGFETDTAGWTGATRVASGTNGVTSATGGFHGEAGTGAFTQFGGYETAFPTNGYTTSVDIYLDQRGGRERHALRLVVRDQHTRGHSSPRLRLQRRLLQRH